VPASAEILLVLDLWEHAWLLDYAPKDRGRFVSDVIDQLNWSVIEGRYGSADQIRRSA
jgi:Fe-Mn family superoxide dismutase